MYAEFCVHVYQYTSYVHVYMHSSSKVEQNELNRSLALYFFKNFANVKSQKYQARIEL